MQKHAEERSRTLFSRRESARKKLLVIEGDGRLRESYRQLLLPYGFEVLCCDDGLDATPLVEQHPDIVLVILDVQMPRSDGRQWLQWFRTRSSSIPILLITGVTLDEGESLGTTATLKKPFEVADLLDMVGLFCGLGSSAVSFRT